MTVPVKPGELFRFTWRDQYGIRKRGEAVPYAEVLEALNDGNKKPAAGIEFVGETKENRT